MLWRKFLGGERGSTARMSDHGRRPAPGRQSCRSSGARTGRVQAPFVFLGAERVISEDDLGGDGARSASTASIRGLRPPNEIARHRARTRRTLFHGSRAWGVAALDRARRRTLGTEHPAVCDCRQRRPLVCRRASVVSRGIVFCDDRVVDCRSRTLISLSYPNPTPWDSPRELEEGRALQAAARARGSARREPEDVHLQLARSPVRQRARPRAQAAEPDLTPVYTGGQPDPIPISASLPSAG